jgi:hypothetical protein
MLVLALNVVRTYFNSIDFNNRKKKILDTNSTDPLVFLMVAYI